MTKAQQIMHRGVQTIAENATLADAAMHMRESQIGALPVRDVQGYPVGIITDRDIVVKAIATGADPMTTTVGEVAHDNLITVDTDTDLDDVLSIMEQHQIRRLPVMEADDLVGIITEADLARHLSEKKTGKFIEAICAP